MRGPVSAQVDAGRVGSLREPEEDRGHIARKVALDLVVGFLALVSAVRRKGSRLCRIHALVAQTRVVVTERRPLRAGPKPRIVWIDAVEPALHHDVERAAREHTVI